MPVPDDVSLASQYPTRMEAAEHDYDVQQLARQVEVGVAKLRPAQRVVWDKVNDALDHPERHTGKLFFIDGPGGTGKTFLYELLLAQVRSQGEVALAVASSGLAAVLLPKGRTAHSRFKIPIPIEGATHCNIKLGTVKARLIQDAALIAWDEAVTMNRKCYETVDNTFRDIMGATNPALQNVPFGGKTVVFGGDMRQIMPVVKQGSKASIVNACINRSSLWRHVRTTKLTDNMRAITTPGEALQQFMDMLLKVGDGTYPTEPSLGAHHIRLPHHMVTPKVDVDDLITTVLGETITEHKVGHHILAPTNVDVDMINAKAINRMPGEEVMTLSADDTVDPEDIAAYPHDFLHTLTPQDLLAHELHLKVGMPVMLIRNLDQSEGKANGTIAIIQHITKHNLQAKIVNGSRVGRVVLMPRIKLISNDSAYPFRLTRRQFPVRPAFAMTINKAQGQTLQHMGLYLSKPVFTHGQLYVALSRVGSSDRVKVCVVNSRHPGLEGVYTQNIVYKEVFLNLVRTAFN